ncbi:MAG: hypothetical protein WD875_09160 [Pirellulales bacterium]
MSRKLAILAVVSLGGLGVAAIVNAQNASESRPTSLTDRLSQIRDQLVGGDDDADDSADRSAEASGGQRRPRDWSAGRKFGVSSPTRSSDNEAPATSRRAAVPTTPDPRTQAPRYAPGTRIGPQPGVPGHQESESAATSRRPAYTADRGGSTNAVPRTNHANDTRTNSAAATAPATSTPRLSGGGVSADSPLKNRLQALRDERFDEVVSGDNLTPQAAGQSATQRTSPSISSTAPATRQTPPQDTTATDARWRSAAPAASVDASPNGAALSAREAARAQTTLSPTSSADANAESVLARDSTPAASSGRYADDRIGASPSTTREPAKSATTDATTDAPAATVARRDAIRPSMRVGVRDATKPAVEATKPPQSTQDAAAASSALLASKSPVLSVRTVGPRTVTIGKAATYQLLLENSGDAAANEVLVTVKLPAWAEIEGAQATAGVAKAPGKENSKDALSNGEGLQWRVSRLDPGAKQRLVVQIVPRQSTPFQLAVQWTFVPEVTKTVVEVQEPKLQLALDGPKEMLYGASEVYRITLSNPGTGDAENVTVLTSTSASAKDGMNKLAVGTLAAGATKTLELKIDAVDAGTLHVNAKATADGDLASQAAADVLVRRAAIKLVATGPQANYAGTQATFEAHVANPGNATAENVRIEAALPIGAKFEKCSAGGEPSADGTKVVWTIPTLAAGSQRAVELTCTLMSAGANRLQVAAAAQGQLSDAAEVATRVEALADLKLEVADPRGPVALGADAVYEVRIRNRGTKSAERVNVVGFFSDGIEPVSATGAKYTIEPGQITFATIDALDPNEEVICKITARATKPGNHVFRAELVCESTETRLVVEETTRFYGDGPVKPAAHAEPIDGERGDAGLGNSEPAHNAGGLAPDLAPPTEADGELRPLSLLDE